MKKIYKYILAPTLDEQDIESHYGAQVLYAGLDPKGIPCVWLLIDPQQIVKTFTFCVVGTGAELPKGFESYAGSFVEEETYVWHVFYKP